MVHKNHMKYLSQSINEWKNLLGEMNVILNDTALNEVQTTTFNTSQRVLAIIKPKNKFEVQESILTANKYRIPIYPISTGKNWGYGSAVPPINNCVVMDLSRLNKIIEYNEKLAYVTVEPGVTFIQLHNYLLSKKSNLVMSNMGGSPKSSLIGNFIERGIGQGHYGNKYEQACNLEIILPTGNCIYTGSDNFPNSKIAKVSREVAGPDIMGLFTQSNLGIVTKMTLWLMSKPKYSQKLFFYLTNNNGLKNFIDKIRILKSESTIKGNFLIANEIRRLARLQQYPWKEMNGKTPLSKDSLLKLKKRFNVLGVWGGMATLNASNKQELISQRQRIKTLFKNLKNTVFFFDQKKYIDQPTDLSIKGLYWRKKQPITKKMNPDKDSCGAIWISPIIPFKGRNVVEVTNLMSKIMLTYGYESNLGINCITDRKIYIIGAIIYDRTIEGEDKKAQDCHKKIFSELMLRGYIPYRLGVNSMSNMPKPKDSYVKFLKSIKNALDPNDILAPGRYDYRQYWQK